MKISCFSGVVVGILLLTGTANAADLERELQNLREDVMVLQRQVYRGTEKENKATSAENAGVQVKIGEYDEAIRKINGRLDELEYKVKQSNDKVDKLNRDIEIRMKILEGRPIPANLSAPAPTLPTTYDAKVANKASRAVVGDKIHGDDLAPIDGAPQPIVPDNIAEPSAGTPPPPPANTINANKPEDMYSNAMQAYNSGFYDEAELAFGDILQQFPKHNLAGNAQYWLGEVYVKQGNLNKAKIAFKDGYEKYKNGNKAPDSLYRLGVTLENLKDKQKACIVFMSFAETFPKANADLTKKVQAEAKKLGCK